MSFQQKQSAVLRITGLAGISAANGDTALQVRLTGVDHEYPLFYSLDLVDGSFITQRQEEEGGLVAVIDDELAEDMF